MTGKKIWWMIGMLLTIVLGQAQGTLDLKLTNKITVNRDSDYVYGYTLPEPSTFSANPEVWYHWYSGGTIKATRGGYDGKLLNGKFSCFYHNKNLEEKGIFKKGVKTGKWVSWHPNGEMESISHWKKGKQVGRSYHYDDQHHLVSVYKYRRGHAILKHPKSISKKKAIAKDTLQKSTHKRKWHLFKKKDKAKTPKVKKTKAQKDPTKAAKTPVSGSTTPQKTKEEKSKKEKKPKVTKGTTGTNTPKVDPNISPAPPIPVEKDQPQK